MRHPYRLPWVPDQVGREWRSRNALFVFGYAYGPFIGGDGRPHEVMPADYARATNGEFLKQFHRSVICSRTYYTRIANLAAAATKTCRLVVLSDLCRVAFVRREASCDGGGDAIVKEALKLFSEYTELPLPSDWHWRRLIESEATAIVALGTVAEGDYAVLGNSRSFGA